MEAPHIPKRAVEVEIQRSQPDSLRAVVYLAEQTATHPLGERLSDVLNSRTFLPYREGTELRFLNKQHILWLRLQLIAGLDELEPGAEGGEGSVAAQVNVAFGGGTQVAGVLRYLLPAGTRRLGDYLEALPLFFPLRTADWLYLINREQVQTVVPVDEALK